MDLDTIKTIATYLLYVLCIYLVLWAYNAYCAYRFLIDMEIFGDPILTPFFDRQTDTFTNVFFAAVFGAALPETRMQLQMLWYRFFPPKPPRDEDVPILE